MVLPEHDARWSVRIQRRKGRVRAYARRSTFDIGSQATLRDDDSLPSSVEYALGALGGDLVCGLEREAAARRISLEAVEVTLSGRLNNILVHIGVIGEQGHAGFESVQGVIYVATDASQSEMQAAWQAALDRSPLFNTFSRAAHVTLSLQIVV